MTGTWGTRQIVSQQPIRSFGAPGKLYPNGQSEILGHMVNDLGGQYYVRQTFESRATNGDKRRQTESRATNF